MATTTKLRQGLNTKSLSVEKKKKHIFNAIAIHSPWWHYVKEKCIDVEGEGLICMYLDLPRG